MELAQEFTKPLSIICQQSWLTREVRDDQRLSSGMVICKKVWKEDLENYRPVNLTSVLGKIMKEINPSAVVMAHAGLLGHEDQPDGFRKGRSCSTNLMSFYDSG